MPDYHDDLRLAHVLADAADAATMDRFKALDLKVETKPDMTPVSEADKAAEELIRGQLAARPPAGRGARRGVRQPGHAARGAGSSTRSTAPRTTCAGCRSGPR